MKSYSIIQRKKYRGDMTWYGRIYDDGIVRYQSLRTKSKMVAKQWLELMNSSRFLPENYFKSTEKKNKTVIESTNKFLNSVSSRAGDATWKAYTTRINIFKQFCSEQKIQSLREFDKESALAFDIFLAHKYQTKTHREILRCIQQFANFCCDVFDMGDWRPFTVVKKPKLVKRAKSFWKPEEISLILKNAPDKHYRLMWALMAYAGLRFSEAISVNALSIADKQIRIVGKGDKEAFQPISEKLQHELLLFGDILDLNFSTSKYSDNTMSCRALRKAVQEAGLDPSDATNHKFRHSFASNLIRAKVNIKAVQQLMRHENVDLTLNTYSHLLQDDLTEAANAI